MAKDDASTIIVITRTITVSALYYLIHHLEKKEKKHIKPIMRENIVLRLAYFRQSMSYAGITKNQNCYVNENKMRDSANTWMIFQLYERN
ncbi:hypothetical protein WA026_022340 [Henosepilachna vigintioctopunctata]|uniref:Uncharacterized protein n=1 Tax=Henosepilachna vigintioctopunctata TaxID=420089 RepID=A0AAW1UWB5_9CUCU